VDDQLSGDVIERAKHRHLLGLAGRRHPQVGADFAQARAR
jgi:hypothetical protein